MVITKIHQNEMQRTFVWFYLLQNNKYQSRHFILEQTLVVYTLKGHMLYSNEG